MDCILFFMMLVFLCIVVFSLSMFAIFPSGFGSHEMLLRHVAKQFGGKFHAGSWFQKGSVTFQYGKVPAYFCIERAEGYYWLRLTVQGSLTAVLLEFTTEEVPDKIRNIVAMPEIHEYPIRELPARDDGRVYHLFTASEASADLFTGAGVQSELQVLRSNAGGASLHVAMRKGQLTIVKRWMPGLLQNDLITEFLYHALRVHDQLELGRAEGIKFVDSAPELGKLEPLKCAVCGDDLGPEFVQCRRCQAPHHEDCWNYNGCCGTYACKETRYVSNQQLRPNVSWYDRFFKKSED
jgi:hypothetical protein